MIAISICAKSINLKGFVNESMNQIRGSEDGVISFRGCDPHIFN